MYVCGGGGGGGALVCLPNYVHTFFHSTIPCRQAAESGRDSGAVLPMAQRHCVDNHLQSPDKDKQEGFQRRCVMNPTSVVCTTYTCICMCSCECVLRMYIALYTKSVIRPWIRHTVHCIPFCAVVSACRMFGADCHLW